MARMITLLTVVLRDGVASARHPVVVEAAEAHTE
jgi:hypothetical protein